MSPLSSDVNEVFSPREAIPSTPISSPSPSPSLVQQKEVQGRGRKGLVHEKQCTNDEIENLINLWSQKEELYNIAHPSYIDRNKKSLIIKSFSENLGIADYEITKRMKSLQSYYGQIRREHSNKTKCASSKRPSWPYYSLLGFLDDGLNPRETISSFSGDHEPAQKQPAPTKTNKK